jgi:hypothetical protein
MGEAFLKNPDLSRLTYKAVCDANEIFDTRTYGNCSSNNKLKLYESLPNKTLY